MREWGTFVQATASVVEEEIEFGGMIWTPNRKLAFVKAEACHSFPLVNSKDRGFTAATLANSYDSMALQLVDFEHRLKFYGHNSDEIVGTVAAVEYPGKKDAIERAVAGEAVPMSVLFGLWRKAEGAEHALIEMAGEENPWKVSMECEFPQESAALYDGEKFYPWSECSSELRELVKPHAVESNGDTKFIMAMGGQDGKVLFTGLGMTKWPSDKTAKVTQVAASEEPNARDRIVVNTGWKSAVDWQEAASMSENAADAWKTKDAPDKFFAYVPADAKGSKGNKSSRKFPLASVQKKDLDPAILRNALARLPQSSLSASEKASTRRKIMSAISKWNSANPKEKITVSEKAFKVVGVTGEGSGHTHEITADLQVLPEMEHEHWFRSMSFDPDKGVLEGITSTHSEWDRDGNQYATHTHKVKLGGKRKQATASLALPAIREESDMKDKLAKFLREQANAIRDEDPEKAKSWDEMAAELESQKVEEDVEAVIEERIKNGDLIPKAKHEEAVATAEKSAEEKVKNEVQAEKEAEERKQQTIANRMKAVEEAKLDPKFTLGKDRTIESVVASIPCTDEGDEQFTQQVEEWKAWSEKTGQAQQTASKGTGKEEQETAAVVPTGGDDGGKEDKPAVAML